MSGLNVFEELRYIVELLTAEYMFAYFFAKKKKGFASLFTAGGILLCLLSVLYIFIREYVAGYEDKLLTGFISLIWYIGLLFLSMLFVKVCFEITVSDMLFISISGYATMHIEYIVVNEVLALGIWSYLRENLLLYIIVSLLTCLLWYVFVMHIFAAKLRACEGRLCCSTAV